MTSYNTTQTISVIRKSWRYLLRRDDSVDKWRSILTDPSSAVLIRQQDENVDLSQSTLQEFSISGRETFASTLTFFTIKIGSAENENGLFSNIRTILEIFVLYSISTSDFRWMYDKRAAYIGRQTEVLSEIIHTPSQTLCPLESGSSQDCLGLAALREKISRREHCRSSIIKKIVELADSMPLDLPFVTYDHGSSSHHLNAVEFVRKLKPTGYYWIGMAYCLAIEQKVYDPPPAYINRQSQ